MGFFIKNCKNTKKKRKLILFLCVKKLYFYKTPFDTFSKVPSSLFLHRSKTQKRLSASNVHLGYHDSVFNLFTIPTSMEGYRIGTIILHLFAV